MSHRPTASASAPLSCPDQLREGIGFYGVDTRTGIEIADLVGRANQDAVFVGVVGRDVAEDSEKFYKTAVPEIVRSYKAQENGSTLCSAIVKRVTTEDGRGDVEITTANLGDSRAVLVVEYNDGSKEAICLTEDHKPDLSRVEKHIKGNGGQVIDCGTSLGFRVNGYLAVGGAIGDDSVRQLNTIDKTRNPLVTEPDIWRFNLSEVVDATKTVKTAKLVVCCDGVFDGSIAVDKEMKFGDNGLRMYPKKRLEKHESLADVVFSLNEAIDVADRARRGSKDDISLAVVPLVENGVIKLQEKAVMATVCDGHGTSTYPADYQKSGSGYFAAVGTKYDKKTQADGGTVAAAVAMQLFNRAKVQELDGLAIGEERGMVGIDNKYHGMNAFKRNPSLHAEFDGATPALARSGSSLLAKPSVSRPPASVPQSATNRHSGGIIPVSALPDRATSVVAAAVEEVGIEESQKRLKRLHGQLRKPGGRGLSVTLLDKEMSKKMGSNVGNSAYCCLVGSDSLFSKYVALYETKDKKGEKKIKIKLLDVPLDVKSDGRDGLREALGQEMNKDSSKFVKYEEAKKYIDALEVSLAREVVAVGHSRDATAFSAASLPEPLPARTLEDGRGALPTPVRNNRSSHPIMPDDTSVLIVPPSSRPRTFSQRVSLSDLPRSPLTLPIVGGQPVALTPLSPLRSSASTPVPPKSSLGPGYARRNLHVAPTSSLRQSVSGPALLIPPPPPPPPLPLQPVQWKMESSNRSKVGEKYTSPSYESVEAVAEVNRDRFVERTLVKIAGVQSESLAHRALFEGGKFDLSVNNVAAQNSSIKSEDDLADNVFEVLAETARRAGFRLDDKDDREFFLHTMQLAQKYQGMSKINAKNAEKHPEKYRQRYLEMMKEIAAEYPNNNSEDIKKLMNKISKTFQEVAQERKVLRSGREDGKDVALRFKRILPFGEEFVKRIEAGMCEYDPNDRPSASTQSSGNAVKKLQVRRDYKERDWI